MTRKDLLLAIDLTACSLYRDGHRDPASITDVQLNDHFGDSCPRLSKLDIGDWHWSRIVAGVKRELTERQCYDQLDR